MAKSLTKSEESTWAMAAHLSALAGLLYPPAPLGLILGPLFVWLFKRKESDVVDENGKEALNFQITVFGASFIFGILSAALKIFLILALITLIAGLGFAIYGGLKAKQTGSYTYPFAVRLIK